MSVFTNPANGARDHAAAYVAAVLDLLGGREPLSVLRETPFALRRSVAGLSPSELRQPERAGQWSIGHVLQHLADAEMVYAWRVRLILTYNRPPLTGYDQDRWAECLRYDEADAAEALNLFEVVRRANLRVIERASPDDLQRMGVHVERGEESLAHLLRLNAGHDLLHVAQIERIRTAISAGAPA